ncbi:MogA/MoaB family molybdenum cofactor biosynthesis protein [Microlunatus soli]|uniref:Molybdenum cofactor synthesis domain-containing protein n=1 Tax=Microlunatus soli TaxID=630515 RepID=A0A1H1R7L1_9ACTN|nr:MogA/MoaB family molybdenum cofactor biosynthesis protein [Microlunatus soli]SDS31496.1 molybdenum cofactor synthesis domain-containing protein [Microlunatus soli]
MAAPVAGRPEPAEPSEGDRSGLSAAVITVSTRASAGVYADRSGPLIVDALAEAGFAVGDPVVVADGEPVATALFAAVAAEHAVIITTGGTGLSPDDHTPEMTRRVIEREMPQLAAAIADYGVDHGVPTAVLSRGIAGTAGRSLIVNLPGSRGGARDGMAVLAPVLGHAVSQLRGGDH